jgi:hypothetical protein
MPRTRTAQLYARTGNNSHAPAAFHAHGEEITRTGANHAAPSSKFACASTVNTRGCRDLSAPARLHLALSEKTRAPAACTRLSEEICNLPLGIYLWDATETVRQKNLAVGLNVLEQHLAILHVRRGAG